MKAQYFGDVNDYRKFALLRLLAGVGGFKIGVCWMLTEPDRTGQGAKREYLDEPAKWQSHDRELFDMLKTVPKSPTLDDLRRVERDNLIPNAAYFEALTPDEREDRRRWAADCMRALSATDLVFFDPDNGLEVSARPRGRQQSNKFAFFDELAPHYCARRSVLVYQHYPRHISRAEVIANAYDKFVAVMPAARMISFRTPFAAFLLVARPEHWPRAGGCVAAIKDRGWLSRFFDVCVTPYNENAFVDA